MEITDGSSEPPILTKFASLLGTTLTNNRLNIPSQFGNGYCAGYVFNKHIRMLISDYELKEDLIIKKPVYLGNQKILFFKFQHVFPKGKSLISTPSVLIATSRINTEEVFAIHSNTETINIEIDADYLSSLINKSEGSLVLQSLLKHSSPLFFEQLVYPSLLKVVDEIINQPLEATFHLFFYRLKAEELICRLLMELDKREEKQLYPLKDHDIQTIYKVKNRMLGHLDIPPVITELANLAGMSPTKLKRLFRQIFGDSIFNYYQHFRIQEAACLLKKEKLTVSETGYRMGFTNLSHFTRAFEKHIGMKPKQYSRS